MTNRLLIVSRQYLREMVTSRWYVQRKINLQCVLKTFVLRRHAYTQRVNGIRWWRVIWCCANRLTKVLISCICQMTSTAVRKTNEQGLHKSIKQHMLVHHPKPKFDVRRCVQMEFDNNSHRMVHVSLMATAITATNHDGYNQWRPEE